MLSKKKAGRLPSMETRKPVGEFAAFCRAALDSPKGYTCFNPGDDEETQVYLHADNVANLAVRALEMFAQQGSHFHRDGEIDRLMARTDVNALRKNGESFEAAVKCVAAKWGVSDRTLSRMIATDKVAPPVKAGTPSVSDF
ncbi:hypothetical protein PO883_31115 [Massilia sp. DJPM01]|uniref:hypothetical protein n=1 Tax=Massilia sp. DJPM01 TaxID=3024404 RepID=UPI00259E38B4|nr:hypothetical protein [Massilia sp. DJPM01]MDM5181632.1 hypothetical protein [Massilia sp. DJPM01]